MRFGIEPDVISGINLLSSYLGVFENGLILQKKSLLNLYETKVKDLVKKLWTDGNLEMYVLGKIVFCVYYFVFLSGLFVIDIV
jgi:hypothetical protein